MTQKTRDVLALTPSLELLQAGERSFEVGYVQLAEIALRLGERKTDIEDLLSIVKSLNEVSRKVDRLAKRLTPEILQETGDGS